MLKRPRDMDRLAKLVVDIATGHWPTMVLISISAMFSQLPCLGMFWISSRSAMRRASADRTPHRAKRVSSC